MNHTICPRKQIVDIGFRIYCEAIRQNGQKMFEICFRIQVVCFCGFQNGEDDRARFCSALRITEKSVLSANHDRADSVLDLIIADLDLAVIKKRTKIFTLIE